MLPLPDPRRSWHLTWPLTSLDHRRHVSGKLQEFREGWGVVASGEEVREGKDLERAKGIGYLVEYLPCRGKKSGGRVRREMIRDGVGIRGMRGGSDGCHGEGKARGCSQGKARSFERKPSIFAHPC
jgi:hypothetical protein